MSSARVTTELSSQHLRWGMLFAMLPFLVVLAARWTEPIDGGAGDYAQYLLHAKAIAEGRPYSDIGYIYTDLNLVGPRNQPPGWPIVLAPFVAVFGVLSPVFKVIMGALVAGFALLAGTFIARRDNAVTGILVAAIVPLAVGTAATNSALSDPLFCLLVWLTVMVADSDGEWSGWRSLGIGLLTLAAISVRVAGVALVPALLAFFVVRNGSRRVSRLLPLGAVLAGLFVIAWVASDQIPFFSRLRSFNLSVQTFESFVTVYRNAVLAQTLYPLPGDRFNDIYHLAILPLVGVGALQVVRKTPRSAIWFLVAVYAAMLFVAPVRDGRYLWPLSPVLAWWLVGGIRVVINWLLGGQSVARAALWQAGTVGAIIVGAATVQALEPRYKEFLKDPDTVQVFDRLREEHDDEAVRVMFINPRVLTLLTGIPAMGVPSANDRRVIAEIVEKELTHVALRLHGQLRRPERNMLYLVERCPGAFPEIFRNDTYTVRSIVSVTSCVASALPAVP